MTTKLFDSHVLADTTFYASTMKFVATILMAIIANVACAQDGPKTVRVFVLAGQSNMQGHAVVDLDDEEHYNGGKGNLLDVLATSNEKFAHLRTDRGWSVRDDVWIRFQTDHGTKTGGISTGFAGYQDRRHFGPELQFGHVLGNYFEEPVLLIKTAWGGKSLKTDFRPPSAVASRGGKVGSYYLKMLEEVDAALENMSSDFPQLAGISPEISGFVWQQGWNDMIDEEARNEYFQNLVDLVDDVRKEWDKPKLPVVVGELGNGGKNVNSAMKHFRIQQSRIDAHPPFVGNVLFAPTLQHARPAEESPNPGHGHHWFGNAESYLMVGDSLGQAMVRLFDQPSKPRVLILGDSISIGYTPYVKQAFNDSAFVTRPMGNHRSPENCAGTDYGIQRIDRWIAIGGGNWDVIHFNFGLHDLKHVHSDSGKNSNKADDPEQSPPAEYEKQLREIVAKLKATGATLIFANTTPVPAGVKPFRDVDAPTRYNEIAKRVMNENEIVINDLFGFANERLDKIQKPADVHFSPGGSQELAKQVVRHINVALAQRDKK